jgi:nucleoside-diphosphate-sugar epimerase
LIGIDKHADNIRLFREIHPSVQLIEADLAERGAWEQCFKRADTIIVNQAQIGGLYYDEFEANNILATKNILNAANEHAVNYFVGISSSVVNSSASDFYTRSKMIQETIYAESSIAHVILRPTLMFGCFDRKHLGWLRRFMDRVPVFPVPGNGQFIRQPLYVGDFVSIIVSAITSRKSGTFDISGLEKVYYSDLIKIIHDITKPKAHIVHIPYSVFWILLWLYASFDKNPPFTTRQLEALVIPETFPVIDWPSEFGVTPTLLRDALAQTFLDPQHSFITLSF